MLYTYIPQLTPLFKIAIAGLLLLAAAQDIMTRTVPNWVPITLSVFGAGLAAVNFRLIWGLGFGLTIFVFCVICWRRGWMGGADVKLLGAAAIIVAPSDAETFILAVTLFGGILSLAYLAGRFVLPSPAVIRHPNMRTRRLLPRVMRVEAWRIRHRGPLPYACAIAAGTLFVLS